MPPKQPIPAETLDLNLFCAALIFGCGVLIWYVVVKWWPKKKKKPTEIKYDFEEWSPYEYESVKKITTK